MRGKAVAVAEGRALAPAQASTDRRQAEVPAWSAALDHAKPQT